ncbi:hypothetical protein AVEN_85243-1 [Araneus ventricosus]|uniref:RNase H type-1 domain-containing protein n=1 Tax=Araneus ventricosus TaxID=182803 RepID=A0A4Y2TL12_ARAVE|nr:hypothetical protein AVEN_85243-1 [Araneus ventricosus]
MSSDPNGRFKKIFTDGSKLNGRIGSGIVCLGKARDIIWKEEIRLYEEASVFVAESVAIQMAVEKVGPTKEKIVILSDSRSVLMALESNKNHSEVIMKLRKILLVNPQIKLNWFSAHVGIYGNELADLSAKNATTKEAVDIKVKIPKFWIKNQLKFTMLQEWQARWMSSPNSRFLYGIFPEVNTKRWPRRIFDKPDTNNSWVLPCAPAQNFWQISRL